MEGGGLDGDSEGGEHFRAEGEVFPGLALEGDFDVIDEGEAGPGSGGKVGGCDGIRDGELGGNLLSKSGGRGDFTFHRDFDGVIVIGAADTVPDAVFQEIRLLARLLLDAAEDEAGFICGDAMDSDVPEKFD